MSSPFATEVLTIGAAATSLTASKYARRHGNEATEALATLEPGTGRIRFYYDGSVPTAMDGHIMDPGDVLTLESLAEISKFQGIRTGGVSGTLTVTYGSGPGG